MTTAEATRKLRHALSLSQQAFATQLGLSITAIQNYEGIRENRRVPAPPEMTSLLLRAEDAGLADAAKTFREELRNQLRIPKGKKLGI